MKTGDISNCISLRELSQYFAGALSEDQINEIDDHLVGCPFCFALSERVANTAQAVLEERFATAPEPALGFLERASIQEEKSATPAIRARIKRWVLGGSELAVGVQFPAVQGLARFLVSGMNELLSPTPDFALNLATVGGTRSGGGDSSDELEGPILEVPGGDRKRARVVVDLAETTHVSVQIDSVPVSLSPPLAAVQIKDSGEAFVKKMERIDSLTGDATVADLVADFNLPVSTREILLLIEGLEI